MLQKLQDKIILFTAIAITAAFLFVYGGRSNSFYGDALGYYLYLPATCIYHDLKTPDVLPEGNKIDDGIKWYLSLLKENKTPKGYHLDQYTYGVALMESPFFLLAYTYEKLTGGRADGYSATYNNLIKAGNLLYAILGLLLVYKVLEKYFTSSLSLLVTVCIFMCTNLFWFSVYQAGMSHVILFFLYALLMYLSISMYERPATGLFIAIGFTTGLIILIRPTDILCLLIPLLYGVYNWDTLLGKLQFLKVHFVNILYSIAAFIVPIIPQLLYWKMMTGSYVYYSYGQQTFNWSHPKIIEGLFYFSNGWFPYSPIMVFAILGLLCYRHIRNWAFCLWLLVPVYVYIIYSWYCYNYINGLGSRPMIHLYPLLAIPLAAFISAISRRRAWVKAAFATLILFFAALNISYSIQQLKGMLDSPESSMAYNYQVLFRNSLRYKDLVTRDLAERQPDTSRLIKLSTLAYQNYKDSLSASYVYDAAERKYVYHVTAEDTIPICGVKWDKEQMKDAQWFKCTGKFKYTQVPDYYKHMFVFEINNWRFKLCKIENKIYDLDKQGGPGEISLQHHTENKWGEVYFFTKVPRYVKQGDSLKVYLRNLPHTEIFIDSVRLELYKNK